MLVLARWLARWPLWLLHLFGGVLGWAVYALAPTYRARFREHAALAGVSPAAARRAVAEAGRLVAELPRLWLAAPLTRAARPSPARGRRHRDSVFSTTTAPAALDGGEGPGRIPAALPVPVEWRGEALVEQALMQGRGLLVLTPHLGSFEIAAQAYAARFGRQAPVTVMYRPARQAWLRALQARSRDRPGLAAVPASLAGVRQMVRALRRGEAVGLLPDQVPPEGLGEWAPFFGRPAYTMTLASRLAAQTGAALLLMWGERLPAGAGYRVHVLPYPEPELLRQGSAQQAAACVNRAMESLVRACPQQYLWGYHRYKAPRPASASPPAGSSAAEGA